MGPLGIVGPGEDLLEPEAFLEARDRGACACEVLRIPLRVEVFDRQTGTQRTTDYVNWQSDLVIPDAFFAPDSHAALTEMDYTEYLRRTVAEGTVGPVPVFYTHMLFKRKD